ncbi:YybH family protein [Pelagibius sp.]|uniref:YybH family protein n=1 Tax=Pelagibius sp. TaxID=1931238 RepID=UPI003BB0EF47
MTLSLIRKTAALAGFGVALVACASGPAPDARAAIEQVLSNYETALNASDVDGVMRLYAQDGVFMPQHSPSSIGAGEVRAAYQAVFEAITLSITFDIAEIEPIASNWAFARTNSAGTVRIAATGAESPEANQKLFIFQKIDGDWKIARYSFSTTNPTRQ